MSNPANDRSKIELQDLDPLEDVMGGDGPRIESGTVLWSKLAAMPEGRSANSFFTDFDNTFPSDPSRFQVSDIDATD